jgi:hypothetical protein
MSAYQVTRVSWDLEHVPGVAERFEADPDALLREYDLTETERAAIIARDAAPLLAGGANAISVRNLMALLGSATSLMYSTSHNGVSN